MQHSLMAALRLDANIGLARRVWWQRPLGNLSQMRT
uniref:Uncharacterized protein n=1 Tax=Utricularia reniformis TaxID=192314 RepID=A0A1Y0B0G4_9LAMI|nr:hypothetical protein AEK19_MT0616 [Utricularia reniformis]ART30871.1 hypothetical protein AEK19_MT0616 [Utricularia reniformis]